ncbi:MAG: four helix bundle protein [Anaerolineales bacterium]|nr:four helix bundle protein [Anaerolineales bacterium]
MNYQEWLNAMPKAISGDTLWKMVVYRYALFVADLAWHDATKLMSDRRTIGLSEQLYEAAGSVGANISEGYSRSSGKDRARFYEYALGSARESRGWYYDGRFILGDEVAKHRMEFLTQIIRLLLTITPEERTRTIRDDAVKYRVDSQPSLETLLHQAPLP